MPASEIPLEIADSKFAARPHPHSVITREITLALLDEPLDPMRHGMDDDDMLSLQTSIRTSGLLENLCVVPVLNGVRVRLVGEASEIFGAHIARGGRFRVAAGHRRLLACRAVRHDPVKCEVFCDTSIHEEEIMHAENTHREDPTDFDLAVLYAKWLKEPGMTEKEFQRRGGKSLEFMYARADILSGYECVAAALRERQIPFSVARLLNRWKEPEFVQHWLNMAVDQGAKQKIVQGWIDERKAVLALAVPAGPQPAPGITVHTQQFQKIECLLCGDPQSYNLTSALMCGACRERITAARAAEEAKEEKTQAVTGES